MACVTNLLINTPTYISIQKGQLVLQALENLKQELNVKHDNENKRSRVDTKIKIYSLKYIES